MPDRELGYDLSCYKKKEVRDSPTCGKRNPDRETGEETNRRQRSQACRFCAD
jgi:hypothetical protein